MFLLLCLLLSSVYAQPVQYGYFRKVSTNDAGSIHVGLVNKGQVNLVFKTLYVNGQKVTLVIDTGKKDEWNYFPPDAKEGDVLWYYFTKPVVNPDGIAELIIKFAKTPIKPVEVKIETEGSQVLTTVVKPTPILLSVSYISFSNDFSKAYIYVQNKSDADFYIGTIGLYSEDINKTLKDDTLKIPLRTKVCLSAKLPKPVRKGNRFYVIIRTKEGITFGASVHAFKSFPILSQSGPLSGIEFDNDGLNSKEIVPHYGLVHDQFDIVGSRIITNLKDPKYLKPEQMSYYCCNQGLIKYGAPYFGELCDAYLLHTEPSGVDYLGRYSNKDFHYTQAKTRYIKECVEPNRLFAITETAHAYGDFYKEMTPEEVRLRAYYNISRGAKGLFWRLGYLGQYSEHSRKMIEKEVARINEELRLLRPLLKIGDNVDGMAETTEPLVEASTILGGDMGIVLILFNHDRSFAWPEYERVNKKPFFLMPNMDPFVVTVELPEGEEVKDLYEVGGDWQRPGYTVKDGKLSFKVSGIDATRQFVIDFGHRLYNLDEDRNGIEDIVEVMNKPLWSVNKEFPDLLVIYPVEGPDVQFMEKQYFFGIADPKMGIIRHTFEFKNVGQSVFKIGNPEGLPSGLKVTIPKKEIEPGEGSEVDMEYTPSGEGKVDLEFLVPTNDPNESEIKLQIGGIVRKELTYYPEKLVFNNVKIHKTVTIVDNRYGQLDITNVKVSSPEIAYKIETTSKSVVDSYADVFNGERLVKTHNITIDSDLIKLINNPDQFIEIETNNQYYPVLKIPIVVPSNIFVKVNPDGFFFGFVKKGSKISKKVVIRPVQDDKFKITEVSSPSEFITVERVQLGKDQGYEITVTLDLTTPVGTIQSNIKVYTNLPEKPVIEIPIYGMVRE